MRILSTGLGFLAAPLVAAILMAALAPIGGGEDRIAWGLIPVFYVFALYATVLFGAPVFFLLRHVELVTWWSSVIAGLAIGALAGILTRLPSSPNLGDFIRVMPVGAVSGFSFWLVWRFVRFTKQGAE